MASKSTITETLTAHWVALRDAENALISARRSVRTIINPQVSVDTLGIRELKDAIEQWIGRLELVQNARKLAVPEE